MSEYVYREHRKSESSKYVKSELVSWVRCEEVIRCRDCAHMFEMMNGFECERISGQYHACEPNGFCAWAERRKND